MFFTLTEDNQCNTITDEQFEEIKANNDYEGCILNHLTGLMEYINPETNDWDTADIEQLEL